MIPLGPQRRWRTLRGVCQSVPSFSAGRDAAAGSQHKCGPAQTPPGRSAAPSGACLLPWHTMLTQAGTPDACPGPSPDSCIQWSWKTPMPGTATFQAENLGLQSKALPSVCPGGSQTAPSCHPKGAQGPRSGPQHFWSRQGSCQQHAVGPAPTVGEQAALRRTRPGGQGHTRQRKAGRPTVRTRRRPPRSTPCTRPPPSPETPSPSAAQGHSSCPQPSCPRPWTTDDSLGTSDLADGLGRLLAQVQPKTPLTPGRDARRVPTAPPRPTDKG